MKKKQKKKAEVREKKIKPELINIIEAILFSSSREMDIKEVFDLSHSKKSEAEKVLKKLQEKYNSLDIPIEIKEKDNIWKMDVKKEFHPAIYKIINEIDLPHEVMDTLAMIGYNHPVLQSKIIEIRKTAAYGHIATLIALNFISRQKYKRSYKISLTKRFFEYFNISEEELKKFKTIDLLEETLIDKDDSDPNPLSAITEDGRLERGYEVNEDGKISDKYGNLPPSSGHKGSPFNEEGYFNEGFHFDEFGKILDKENKIVPIQNKIKEKKDLKEEKEKENDEINLDEKKEEDQRSDAQINAYFGLSSGENPDLSELNNESENREPIIKKTPIPEKKEIQEKEENKFSSDDEKLLNDNESGLEESKTPQKDEMGKISEEYKKSNENVIEPDDNKDEEEKDNEELDIKTEEETLKEEDKGEDNSDDILDEKDNEEIIKDDDSEKIENIPENEIDVSSDKESYIKFDEKEIKEKVNDLFNPKDKEEELDAEAINKKVKKKKKKKSYLDIIQDQLEENKEKILKKR